MSKEHDILSYEESIKKSIEGVEITPSAQLWDRVASSVEALELAAPAPATPAPAPAPAVPLISLVARWCSVAAAIVVAALGLRWALAPSEHLEADYQRLAAEIQQAEPLAPSPIEPLAPSPLAQATTNEPAPRSSSRGGVTSPSRSVALSEPAAEAERAGETEVGSNLEATEPQEVAPDNAAQEPSAPSAPTANAPTASTAPSAPTASTAPEQFTHLVAHRTPSRFDLGFNLQGGASAQTIREVETRPVMTPSLLAESDGGYFKMEEPEKYLPTNIEHLAPISFGATLAYRLSERWSVESGLSYTLLRSQLTMSYSEHPMRQELKFVGVPLRLRFNVVENTRFTLYAAAGTQLERCISSQLAGQQIAEQRWHLSADCALGAQYRITRRLGIYCEPEVAYYFGQSNLITIRTDSPLSLGLRLGLRFSFGS